VGSHQRVTASPVEIDRDDVPDRRRTALRRFELVDDVVTRLAGRADGPGSTVRSTQEQSAIGRLTTATRVEDRPIEDDERRLPALVDRLHPCLRRTRVGIRVGELPGNVHVIPAYWTVRTPFIVVGWTSHMKA